ncbi:hypothetical protein AB0J82_05895 [Asanoa sp. NPDC049518]|uniref:TolB family protein n=1 Tax=unclassified Asanoa TaxID=2685164 RepID=UPI00342BAAC8
MPDFDDDRLHEMFAEFRGEVAPYVSPPGTAAARHWVRRRRRVGAAAIAAGAVLFVGGPTVGFVAANHDTPTPPPIGPTGLPTPNPTTPAPTPETPTPTETSTPPSQPGLPKISGKVFYVDQDGKLYQGGRKFPGGDVLNVNVSPDGKQVTWVENGDLVISDLDGRHKEVMFPDVEEMCTEPIWNADGERLLVTPVRQGKVTEHVVVHQIGTGEPFDRVDGCHIRWSADGERIAYQHGDVRGVTVRDLFGGNEVVLDEHDVDGRYYVGLNGISADGGRICVWLQGPDSPAGDAARDLGCNTIMDVAKKKVVEMPFDGQLTNAIFLADGGMLARVKTDSGSELLRLDADDRVIARSVESKANAGRRLLAYTP